MQDVIILHKIELLKCVEKKPSYYEYVAKKDLTGCWSWSAFLCDMHLLNDIK